MAEEGQDNLEPARWFLLSRRPLAQTLQFSMMGRSDQVIPIPVKQVLCSVCRALHSTPDHAARCGRSALAGADIKRRLSRDAVLKPRPRRRWSKGEKPHDEVRLPADDSKVLTHDNALTGLAVRTSLSGRFCDAGCNITPRLCATNAGSATKRCVQVRN
jgi:hypothetical protein